MNTPPVVSVVIIFLNAEKFLREAVESVLSQTYREWELILVDDGSTDDSSRLAREYAGRPDGRIRYVEHDGHRNLGMSASRNRGARESRGTHLAFLDADDTWLPHKLEEQMRLAQANPTAAMIYGPGLWWVSWTGGASERERDSVQNLGFDAERLVPAPRLQELFLRTEGVTPSPSGILVQKKAFDEIGGFEEAFRGMYEDQAFYAKVTLRYPIYVSRECWYRYRQHAQANTRVATLQGTYRADRERFLRWLKTYLATAPGAGPYVFEIVEEQLSGSGSSLTLWKRFRGGLRSVVRPLLPSGVRRLYRALRDRYAHGVPVGGVRFGSLRRTRPISRSFGYDRGGCIDRYYLERFLERNASDIRGRVLEIADSTYTRRFGGSKVTKSDVLHAIEGNAEATVVGDLASGQGIPVNAFDCAIVTQTLHVVYDVRGAIRSLYNLLKPGGVALVSLPGITQISRYDMNRWGDYWRFTSASARRLFEEVFPPAGILVESQGNVLVAVSFLHGLSAKELTAAELDERDPDYEVMLFVRVVKPGGGVPS